MRSIWILLLFGSLILYNCIPPIHAGGKQVEESDEAQTTYSQCKPYVDAALKDSKTSSTTEESSTESVQQDDQSQEDDSGGQTIEESEEEETSEQTEESTEEDASTEGEEESTETSTEEEESTEVSEEEASTEEEKTVEETEEQSEEKSEEQSEETSASEEKSTTAEEESQEESTEEEVSEEAVDETAEETQEESTEEETSTEEDAKTEEDEASAEDEGSAEDTTEDTTEEAQRDGSISDSMADTSDESKPAGSEEETQEESQTTSEEEVKSEEESGEATKSSEEEESGEVKSDEEPTTTEDATQETEESAESEEESAEQWIYEGPDYEPRTRDHLENILGLDDSDETKKLFTFLQTATQSTLKDLKSVYEGAIKPLEMLYKYRDLSNRHFGDPEIFSKPMIVFMGPWSGGKSTIINWLLGIQHEEQALRMGADPSPAQFNIMIHGKEDEVLDGTQLAADWTFSGLQKFGQSFLDRLRGRKMPNRLLEKVNLVEIPGILEVRKQVERSFPFNDACQWFIDRADLLFLIYDPAKLDIGPGKNFPIILNALILIHIYEPETEAILDQLKGRENQVRIVLNKADSVKPDELLRVQATLVWNISPLMSSAEPPMLYAASLWDKPLQPESPTSLLLAHENSFLKDIRDVVDKRVETRIAASRRFAVRVRNHAKMVDCYLNTYNNHRSFFSDKKKVSNDIIEHPQNYHIYEGLSTLTNISRYDLPDPDTYRDFFKLNPLWNFQPLSSTCTYFRGCPINKLDIAIAYELPEILGKFRRQREAITSAQQQGQQQTTTSSKK